MSLSFNKLKAILGGSALGPIGGIARGAAGTGIYSGYTLADGDEFYALDLYSASNPAGSYMTTRAYRQNNSAPGEVRAPATGALAVMHDVDPTYTGWKDANRGVAVGFDSHTLVSGEGTSALRLKAVRQSAPEQALLNTGVAGQIERGSMIHTAARLWWNAPGIIEFRARMPAGNAGQHPTVWAISAQPPGSINFTGSEYGFEGNSVSQQDYQIPWNAGSTTGAQTNTTGLGATFRDGNYHTFTIIVSPTNYKYYVDGTLINTITADPQARGNKAEYMLISNHVYNTTFLGENYSAAAWAGGNPCYIDVEWYRVWYPTSGGAYFYPLVNIPITYATLGTPFSITIPDQTTLWGSSGLTEVVTAIQSEIEEPCGGQTTYGLLPTGITYNSGTRVLSGTLTNTSGTLMFVIAVSQDNAVCKPARILISAAPAYQGLTAFNVSQNVAFSYDVYSNVDVGRNFVMNPSNPRGLSVSGLPTGLSFNASTGLITGTPTTLGSGSITIGAVNGFGQTTSQVANFNVIAANTPVPAPTITGSPTLRASWDFNDLSKITQSTAGIIDSIAGSDGTSVTLSSSGSNRPTIGTRYSKNTAEFLATNSQYLQIASASGVVGTTGCTLIVIAQADLSATAACLLDISNGAAAAGVNRYAIITNVSNIFTSRKCDATVVGDVSQASLLPFNNIHPIVAPMGANASANSISVDGTTLTVDTLFPGAPTGLTTTTLGARQVAGAPGLFFTGAIFRVLVYAGALTQAQCDQVAAWAQINYGCFDLP